MGNAKRMFDEAMEDADKDIAASVHDQVFREDKVDKALCVRANVLLA